MNGVSRPTIAKIIDIWGRVEGFFSMLLLIVLGMIMKATCRNVETYAAAHTLFWVGHLGLMYIVDIIVADITTLRNRMIIFGVNSTPTICTVFCGAQDCRGVLRECKFSVGVWRVLHRLDDLLRSRWRRLCHYGSQGQEDGRVAGADAKPHVLGVDQVLLFFSLTVSHFDSILDN